MPPLYNETETLTQEGQQLHEALWRILSGVIAPMVVRGYPVRDVCHLIISVAASLENYFLLDSELPLTF